MEHKLHIYNTLSRKKELFVPIKSPNVGMYVCGPTVYGDAHLGHARPAITFDILFRYLKHLGYKVRYVRNITDVGHLENDADSGEDKIQKKALLEQLEPMEIAKNYADRYHKNMDQLNTLHPSIEPTASGHVIEQMRLRAPSILMWKNTINTITTENYQEGRLKSLLKTPASLQDRKRKKTASTLLCGKKPTLSILCTGHRHGAKVIRAGILNVLPWGKNTSAKPLIFMAEEWTCYFPITSQKLHRQMLTTVTIL